MKELILLSVILSVAYCATLYTLTQQNHDFNPKQIGFNAAKDPATVEGQINTAKKYQTIIGFGASFTDATGINLNKAPAETREKILKLLFSKDGIGLNLCRVTIGGTEFSSRAYSLDDHDGDTTLQHFALQEEDLVHKVNIVLTNVFIVEC